MPRPRSTTKTGTVHLHTELATSPDEQVDSTGLELRSFERYHPARHQFPKREGQIAITRAGNFSLTGDLGEMLVTEDGKGWIQLAYSKTEKRIAIIEASEEDVDILRVSRTPKGHRFQITARRFLETYGIPLPDKGTHYQPAIRLVGGKQVFIIQV